MKQTFFTICLASVILTGCVTARETKDCHFSTAQGKEFVFRKQSPSLQKYAYLRWQKTPNFRADKLNYKDYVGTYGKVQKDIISGEGKVGRNRITGESTLKYMTALTDTCEIIYTMVNNGQTSIGDLEIFTGIYFTQSIKKAKLLIGKDIWTKAPFGVEKARVLFTSDPNISYPKGTMEKLHVLNIDTTSYGHTYGAAPFFLVVKTGSGKEGLIPYSSEYFYESNPIK